VPAGRDLTFGVALTRRRRDGGHERQSERRDDEHPAEPSTSWSLHSSLLRWLQEQPE
jgi:hypothetical protein